MSEESAKKKLKIYGWIFAIVGILELWATFSVALCFISSYDWLYEYVTKITAVDESVFRAGMIVVIICLLVFAIANICLASKGFKASKGEKVNDQPATIFIVLNTIGAVLSIITMIKTSSTATLKTCIIDVVWIILLIDYKKAIKTLCNK